MRGRSGHAYRLPPGLAAVSPAVLAWSLLFAVPLIYFFVISFWSVRARIMRPDLTARNYVATLTDYGDVLVQTLFVGLVIAFLTTLTAYLFAFAIRFRAGRWANALLLLTLVTLFGGYLVKIYAWKSILGREGILNGILMWTGIIDEPLDAVHLQRKWSRHHPHVFFAPLRHPADLRQHARHSRQPASRPPTISGPPTFGPLATSCCLYPSAASAWPSC